MSKANKGIASGIVAQVADVLMTTITGTMQDLRGAGQIVLNVCSHKVKVPLVIETGKWWKSSGKQDDVVVTARLGTGVFITVMLSPSMMDSKLPEYLMVITRTPVKNLPVDFSRKAIMDNISRCAPIHVQTASKSSGTWVVQDNNFFNCYMAGREKNMPSHEAYREALNLATKKKKAERPIGNTKESVSVDNAEGCTATEEVVHTDP